MTQDPRFSTDPIGRLVPALADRYAVERTLGRGGMAIVYLARDLKHDRHIALKILRPEIASEIGTDRFLKEIQTTAKLNHPHILPLLDSGEAGGFLFYVMPYVQGETLADLLQRERQLSIGDSVRIAREVAEALGHAHSYGIVHRDIKPQNILLSGGHAVVADFGIARALTEAANERLTETGMAVGTPAYMSPEQALGDPNVDARSDVYSLACVLYEMLVGQIPFTGPSAQAILARHSLDSVPPPHIMRDTIPEELEGIIMCGLAKSPADRFRTGSEFAEALTTMDSGATHLRRPSRATQAPRRRIPRRPAVIAAIAVVVLGLGAWWAVGSGRGQRAGRVGSDLDPRNVAVLYFTDLSRQGTLAHVADGLTEGLIDELSRVSVLDVVSRNGVAPYRAGTVPRDSIARALHVGSLIEGTVEPSGERVRVAVRLVDGASGADIERASFELPARQLLAVRDSVVGEVARLLRSRLGQEVQLRERRTGTTSEDAWTLVQRAEKARRDAEGRLVQGDSAAAFAGTRQADSLLAEAERADPRWAEPTVLRGYVARLAGRTRRTAEQAGYLRQGLSHAQRALELGPGNPAALELRGTLRYSFVQPTLEPDPARRAAMLDSARADLEAAVRANPMLATAHATLSRLHYGRKDVVSAVLEARTAYEADAYLRDVEAILDRLFWGSYDIAQFVEARRWCGEGARRFPANWRFAECQLWLLISPGADADVPGAWRLAMRTDSLTPGPQRPFRQRLHQVVVAAVLARAGDRDSAERVLGRARTDDPAIDATQDLPGYEALVRAQMGEADQAIEMLKRYVATHPDHSFQRGGMLHWWWRDLERHPGFREVMRATR